MVVTKPNKSPNSLSKLKEETTYHGQGIFPSQKGKEAADRALKIVLGFEKAPFKDKNIDSLRSRLAYISSEYFSDVEYFSVRPAQVRDDIKAIGELLSPLMQALEQLPRRSKETLNQQISRERINAGNNSVDNLLNHCRIIKPVCDAVALLEGTKTSREALPRCCFALEAFWKDGTGKRFSRTKEQAVSGAGSETVKIFTSPGVHFVHSVMQAIDPTVEAKQILSWVALPIKATEEDFASDFGD